MVMYFPLGRMNSNPALSGLDDVTLTRLATSACAAVQNFCNRTFTLQSYDELYQGTPGRSLFLNQYPVVSVKAVRTGQTSAVQVQNTTANIQAATVAVTPTAVVLTTTANAADTVVTLNYADYPTLGQLTTHINGLGNGWTATITGQFTAWATADLAVYQTTQSARQTAASLSPHYYYASGYQLNPATGELTAGAVGTWFGAGTAAGWNGAGLWPVRVQYTAGYDPVPEEIIQATIELAASTYRASKVDPNLQSESLGGYSYTRAATKSIADLSIQAQATLRYYRKPRVPYFGVS